MDAEVVKKILAVQEAALGDARYNGLMAEYEILNSRFLDVLPTLDAQQRDAVMDFLGLTFAMHLRLMEISCAQDEKS